ncbi:hypothetical protein QCA50_014888 [Cerrena zonata]|uniref:DUF6534 domain-containing protein n=1 Tax=Cerrena zonata TaxID=2478898 RepID=A0AAW0FM97_9APHY
MTHFTGISDILRRKVATPPPGLHVARIPDPITASSHSESSYEILATVRFTSNFVVVSKMIEINHFSIFSRDLHWIITLGLSLGTAVDVLIATSLCWYLNKGRTGFRNMESVIDSIIVYTIETSAITSLTTISSLIFWLIMPNNLIFIALHFVISKLYANVLFATLNARKVLRRRSAPIGNTSDLSMSWVRPRSWDRTEFPNNNSTSNQPSPV